MDNWKLGMYVREIGNQADMFRVASTDFNAAYKVITQTHNREDDAWVRLFSSFQTMLSAAAMMSKLLWVHPVTVNHMGLPLSEDELRIVELSKQRARALRRALGVRDIPILASRKVRNAIEHLDDRLDRFFDTPDRFWVVDHNIGNPNEMHIVVPTGDRPAKTLRNYDPDTGTVSVFEDSINLQELADAVSDLDHKSRVWLATSQEPEA